MDKVVIVTGASGGLGSAIARAFGAAGYRVMVHYNAAYDQSDKKASEVAAAINRGPGEAIIHPADVRDFEQVKQMVDTALAQWHRIDTMACVHGTTLGRLSGSGEKLILEHTDADWDLVLETNLKGVFNCIKAVAVPMIEQKDGQIIIMSSGTGMRGKARNASYAASKAGIYGLMKTAAWEFGPHNVRVNAINPGLVVHMPVLNDDITYFINETTLGRTGNAEEVARFFVHLAGMNNVSGQILNLDSRILF